MKLVSLNKDIKREFKKSFSRFLSILIIVCLGVGFFAGMKATAPTMIRSAQEYFNQHNLMDVELMSLLGFTNNDVIAVKSLDGIDDAEAGYSVDALVRTPYTDTFEASKILSLPKEGGINQVDLLEGRMPEKSGECVACPEDFFGNTFALGDVIELAEIAGTTNMREVLRHEKYTVVGIVKSPLYVSFNFGSSTVGDGELTAYFYVPAREFLYDAYTEMYVSFDMDYSKMDLFDKDYQELFDANMEKLDALGKERMPIRLKEINDEMDSEYNEGVNDANEQLADAQKQLDDALAQLREGKLDLQAGWKEYDEAYAEYQAEIRAAEQEIADGEQELEEGKQALAAAQDLYEQNQEALAATTNEEAQLELAALEASVAALQAAYDLSGLPEDLLQLEEAQQALEDARAAFAEDPDLIPTEYIEAQIAAAEQQIADGEAQLAEGRRELSEAKEKYEAEFEKARKELEAGEAEYNAGLNEYYEGLDEFEIAKADTERQLSEAAAQIQNARDSFEELSYEKWYLMTREDMVTNYDSIQQDAERIDALSVAFPAFFLLVAALVCVTTMTRMVEEQRGQMGTYKALGYSNKQILKKYLCYSLIASIIGGILGELICIQIFPRVISNAYELMYKFPKKVIVYPWLMMGIGLVVGLLCTAFVTYICCRTEVKSVTAALMRPRAPKAGKQIFLERTKLWDKFTFSTKITIRNLFRYKIRVLMTVIGITGCMALIVAGFGVKNAIDPLTELQFGKICHYDFLMATYSEYANADASTCHNQLLNNKSLHIEEALMTYQSDVGLKTLDGNTEVRNNTMVFVPQTPDELNNYVNLYDINTGAPLTLDNDGIVLTSKAAKMLNVSVGDSIYITRDNEDYEIQIAGITENYIYHYAYMTPHTFASLFGSAPTYNVVLGNTEDGVVDTEKILNSDDNFLTITLGADMRAAMSDGFQSMNMVILVLILSASALAVVVLYNLTNINISERIREIATTKVLGFTRKESNMYIFRENVIMTIVGLILGCIGGYFLAQFIISMVEVDIVVFSRTILWTSYLYSILITIGITIGVLILMSRKIKKIDMVEALKSIE